MKLTFLGTGTSHGVPVIACSCKVCKSKNHKNKRNRSSVFIQTDDNKNFIVDTTPEFRIQCLKYKIKKIDAVFYTHSHADHLHGVDDLRIFSSIQCQNSTKDASALNPPIPVYTNKTCKDDLEYRFPYFFMPVKEGGGHANIALLLAQNQFTLGNTIITPIPLMHGKLETVGWLFSKIDKNDEKNKVSIAYLTDCNFISKESFDLIKSQSGTLKHLIIDGLRIKHHSTHFSFLEAMQAANEIKIAEHVWFTHLTHNSSHKDVIKYIKQNINQFPELKEAKSVLPAFDGLVLKI